PEIRILEIFLWGDAKQLGDALADEGRLKIVGYRAAVNDRGRGVKQPRRMGVGRGLNVGNSLQALFLLFGNLPLMRGFALAEHLVEGAGEAPDLALTVVIGAVALIARSRARSCRPPKPPEGPHEVAIGDKSEQKAQGCQRAAQPEGAM